MSLTVYVRARITCDNCNDTVAHATTHFLDEFEPQEFDNEAREWFAKMRWVRTPDSEIWTCGKCQKVTDSLFA